MSELLDIYDADGNHLGVKPRDAVHRDGDWHRAFHLWVRCGDGVLFQRRGYDRPSYPGMLDATAAGHLLAGETIADGMREVQEELGVTWPMEALEDLGVHRVEDGTNREFQHVYAVRDERPLRDWPFNREEVAGLVLVTPNSAVEWDGDRERAVTIDPGEIVRPPYLSALGLLPGS
ncbi:MAG TPA: NUDIX domain-containing protein [Solirubrobacteraceae bacterium]